MKNSTTYETKYENVEDSTQKKKSGIVLESLKSIRYTKNYKIFNYSKDVALICNETEPGFRVESHFHDWIEFSYVLDGEQDFMIKDQTFTICTGDFLMVNLGEMHGSVKKTACKKIALQIKSSFIKKYLPEVDTSILFCNSTTLKTKEEFIIYHDIVTEFKKIVDLFLLEKPHKYILIRAQIFIIFYKLIEILEKNENHRKKNEPITKIDINDLIAYINNNYQTGITMNEVARQFNYSPSFISKFFKERVGMNFTDYVNELKLSQAVYEIVHSDLKISDICYSCGFNNSKSFFKAFKNKYNVTPKQYQEFHKKSI